MSNDLPRYPRPPEQGCLWWIFPTLGSVHSNAPAPPHHTPLTAGSLTQQEKGTPQRSRLGFKSVQLK